MSFDLEWCQTAIGEIRCRYAHDQWIIFFDHIPYGSEDATHTRPGLPWRAKDLHRNRLAAIKLRF
ncbi:hypothetical protein Brsp01_41700 [Brucella sp. NBRC 12950]|nr:hypothetical protein Brsp01_41700 [Brucella sp. NBRC 12950]